MRDKKHLRQISQLPCMICCSPAPNDAHHLMRTGTRGMGQKSGDEWVVPLCNTCHRQVTLTGREEEFWEAHGWDYDRVKQHALSLYETEG